MNRRWSARLRLLMVVVPLLALAVFVGWKAAGQNTKNNEGQKATQNNEAAEAPKVEPTLKTETVLSGHSNIWDVIFPDADTMFYSVRAGEIWGYSLKTQEKWQVATVNQVVAEGEGGLLGLALDINFSENRYGYMCYNAAGKPKTVRVARFRTAADRKSISDVVEIVRDIESQAGRHSGCRMAMDANGHLWIGTGDSAIAAAAQNPKSLAGKVLRVDRDGRGVAGNLSDPFDSRIFSFGHRNIQGLVLFDSPAANGSYGYTAEHGSGREDEVNPLLPGNFGWDPKTRGTFYDESVPMTDLKKYPDAVSALWSSGNPTIAISGIGILKSERWSAWQNRLVVAVLKDKHLLLLELNADGSLKDEKQLFKDDFGRIRTSIEGPDGSLYLTTDNGSDDKIIRVSPQATF